MCHLPTPPNGYIHQCLLLCGGTCRGCTRLFLLLSLHVTIFPVGTSVIVVIQSKSMAFHWLLVSGQYDRPICFMHVQILSPVVSHKIYPIIGRNGHIYCIPLPVDIQFVGSCYVLGILIPLHYESIVELICEMAVSVVVEAVHKRDFHLGLLGLCSCGLNLMVICVWRVHSCIFNFLID